MGEGEKELVVEAVCVIPFTNGSDLKKRLQERDYLLSQTLSAPKIRFVES